MRLGGKKSLLIRFAPLQNRRRFRRPKSRFRSRTHHGPVAPNHLQAAGGERSEILGGDLGYRPIFGIDVHGVGHARRGLVQDDRPADKNA